MIRAGVLALGIVAGPALAERLSPEAEALAACLDAADRDPEAERACAGAQALACMDAGPQGQTTLGMAGCYAAETEAWEAVIAGLEADILARAEAWAAEGPDQAILLRRAQVAWTNFRRADCAQAAAIWGAGSMRAVAAAECVLDRTAARARDLLARRQAFEAP